MLLTNEKKLHRGAALDIGAGVLAGPIVLYQLSRE
jgi:hypothetical protein